MTITLDLESTDLMKELKKRDSRLYGNILTVYTEIKPLLDHRVGQVFPTYTQHDSGHSLRIMSYMSKIVSGLDKLNDFELTLLIYSALLHDIGMAASQEEINKIKSGELSYEEMKFDVILKKFDNNEVLALQEYLREFHAKRSAEYIQQEWAEKLVMPEMPSITFGSELALICESHTQDMLWVKEKLETKGVKGDYEYNLQFCALVLRLADILDFDSQRTPWKLFKSIEVSGYSKGEWLQHYNISNRQKIIEKEGGQKIIEFYGSCDDPKIHRKILTYIDWINDEIENINDLSEKYEDRHKMDFYHKVNNFIKSNKYSIVDLKFQVNYERMINLLMGEELYGNRELGLRELVQNSIDACMIRKEIKDSGKESWEVEHVPTIYIIIDKLKNQVTIKDNGIGMNLTVLKKYFLELGASFYNSNDYHLSNYKYTPIGNFGIGFLASFMLSDAVKIRTKHLSESTLLEVDIFKEEDYVCVKESDNHDFEGTEIILNYEQFFEVWESPTQVVKFLEANFLSDKVNITVVDKASGNSLLKVVNKFQVDSMSAITDLSKYLSDIDVLIQIYSNEVDEIFVKYLDEIKYVGEPFVYDGENLYRLDDYQEKFKISDFLHQNRLNIFNFLIVEDADEIDNIKDYIDDAEDVKMKYMDKRNPDIISLITKDEYLESVQEGHLYSESPLDGLSFDKFEEYGYEHDNNSGTFYTDESIKFYTWRKMDIHIPFEPNVIYERLMKPKNQELYIRGVYVKKLNFSVEKAILDMHTKFIKVNVINKEIKPNVNRIDINKKDEISLQQSIYQALILHLYETIQDPMKQLVLLKYLNEHHNYSNSYLKEEYKKKIDNA